MLRSHSVRKDENRWLRANAGSKYVKSYSDRAEERGALRIESRGPAWWEHHEGAISKRRLEARQVADVSQNILETGRA